MLFLIKLTLVLIGLAVILYPLYLVYVVIYLPLQNAAYIGGAQLCNIPLLLILSVVGFTILWNKFVE